MSKILEGGLTADESVAIALRHSPRLRAVLLDAGISRAEFAQASFPENPSLAMALRFPSGGGSANLEASLLQNVAELWRLPSRRRASEASLRRAIVAVAREVSGLAYGAKAAYVRAAAGDRLATIASENREIAARFLELALARRKGGEGSGIDVGFARAELSSAEVALRSASLAAFERRAELAGRLGLITPPAELVLSESLSRPDATPPALEEVLARIPHGRLDIAAARRAVEAAQATLRYERLGFLSLLGLGAAYERPEERTGEGGGSSGAILGPSLALEIPLFDQNRAQIAKAALAHRQAEELLSALLVEATQATRAAHERLASTLAVCRLYEAEILPEREQNLELVRQAYRAGELPIASMLEAQRSLLGARVEFARALEEAALASIEFERVTGRPAQG
ncbi:TolC family protein [Tautonia sociabilis]|uniref:TolC family protein n=1 Tax=Tautonia sociabilis TaxID=2080755 RepID=UPI00131520CD|nr:TolC family protein [Tautonia sociabilis]